MLIALLRHYPPPCPHCYWSDTGVQIAPNGNNTVLHTFFYWDGKYSHDPLSSMQSLGPQVERLSLVRAHKIFSTIQTEGPNYVGNQEKQPIRNILWEFPPFTKIGLHSRNSTEIFLKDGLVERRDWKKISSVKSRTGSIDLWGGVGEKDEKNYHVSGWVMDVLRVSSEFPG